MSNTPFDIPTYKLDKSGYNVNTNINDVDFLRTSVQNKADRGMLNNIDIRTVQQAGIYVVGDNCTGLPFDASTENYFSRVLIVYGGANNSNFSQTFSVIGVNGRIREYYGSWIIDGKTVIADLPWTLAYDSTKSLVEIDKTLSKTGTAADAKAAGDELGKKAEKGVLSNIDIRSIFASGIYSIGYGCTGYPNYIIENEWDLKMLIVSTDNESSYSECTQYLFLAKTYPSVAQMYIGKFIQANGSITPNVFWTLVYDTSIPQVTLDNTLSEEGAAADAKAVGDALNKKEDISFINPTVFNASNFYPSDSEPFAKYNEENGFVSLRSTVNGAWSVGQEYMNNFSFEVVNDKLQGINIIFAEDSEKYYMINCKHQSNLKYLGLLQNINKSTGKETGLTYKNSLSERNFENGEKILFRYIPNVTVAQDTVVNRYIVYRKKSCDVCFRQYLVFDFDVNVTPIVGFYSYDKISNSEIRGLYVDIDMPEYPVYNGAVLTNKSADDYILKLQNKKWWALGDSLTAFSESSYTDTAIPNTANYSENKVYGVNYINFVQSKTGCKVCLKDDGNNYGMSAHSLTDHDWSLWSRKDLDSWDSIEADIITLFAGTNDYYYSAPLGTLSDYINNTGISTFYGALKIYIDYFKTKNNIDQRLKIVLITPIQRFNDYSRDVENELGLKLIDYVNAIKNVGAYESITVVDLYNCGGIGANNAADVLRDGLHPNKIGYELIADKIAEGITSGYIFSTTSQAEIDKTLTKDGAAADAKAVGDALLKKEDKIIIKYTGEQDAAGIEREMPNKTELRINDLFTGEIAIILPEEIADDYISSIVFESSSPARTLTYPSRIQMTGADCIEGVFVPEENKRYTLYLEYDGKYVNGYVSGTKESLANTE